MNQLKSTLPPLEGAAVALGVKAVQSPRLQRPEETDALEEDRKRKESNRYKNAWHHRTKEKRKEILRAQTRKYYWNHREQRRDGHRRWAATHGDYLREKETRNRLMRDFGLTKEQYDSLHEQQNGKCAICGNACSSGRRLAVDHSHKTKGVRGLLCGNCNLGLGKFKDSAELMKKAAAYLESFL